MASFRELLAQTKAQIREVDTADGGRRRSRHARHRSCSTCASPTSTSRAPSPAPCTSPAATSRASVESRVPDHDAPVVVYCAGGTRSRVRGQDARPSSATPTSSRWPAASTSGRTRAATGRRPQALIARAAQPLPAPPAAARGRRGGPAEAARRQGAAARRRRPRLARRPVPGRRRRRHASASSTWTWSTSRTCSARSCTTSTASASARSTRPRRRSPLLNPDVNVVAYDVRLGADNVLDIIDGYDVIVDGADNFPTRYLLNDASLLKRHPRRARLDLPLRGPGHGVRAVRRPVLPLLDPRAAAGRAGAVVRRGRRARRAARHHRLASRPWRRSSCSSTSATRCRAGCWPTTRSRSRSARSRSTAIPTARRARRTRARSSSPSTTSCACPTRTTPSADQRPALGGAVGVAVT